MEEFPFNFNLSYQGQDFIVKPPSSLFKLKEMASKQYDIEIEEMVYIPENENDENMIINNEQDYADLIQYVSDHNLEEIIIHINREKEEENEEKDDDNKDEEEEKEDDDKKNKKGGYKGNNKKHNKGVKEQKRIGYIIEKKQMQRDEAKKEEQEKKKKKK